MKTQHEDKVAHILGQPELRKYPSRMSHVLSETDSKEIFCVRWDKDKATITKNSDATKAERREWLLALADALEEGLWNG